MALIKRWKVKSDFQSSDKFPNIFDLLKFNLLTICLLTFFNLTMYNKTPL